MRIPVFLLCLSLSFGLASTSLASTVKPVVIDGRVLDYVNNPLPHARIHLIDRDTGGAQSTSTDSDGHFEIVAPRCKSCSLEIDPPDKTGLSMAIIDDVPGSKTRHFAIHLERGFLVSGRVRGGRKGLKGLAVKVETTEARAGKKDTVHGGGSVVTGNDGKFALVLTPGAKELTVVNARYSHLKGQLKFPFTVTADEKLADLILPPATSAK